jgi:hypothetical protein
MTMINRVFAVVIALLSVAMPVLADDTPPHAGGGRYTFSKVADGFLRLDTQTGEVSLCSRRTVGWACVMAPEDRAAFESEIARLRSENAALKKDILSRGLPLPPGASPLPAGARDRDLTLRLPSDADLDRVMAFVGRVWQRLVEAIAKAQQQALHKS